MVVMKTAPIIDEVVGGRRDLINNLIASRGMYHSFKIRISVWYHKIVLTPERQRLR